MIKKILYILIILVLAYLGLCSFGPKKMSASSTKTISNTPDQIFAQVSDFKNWPNWSKWIMEDSLIQLEYGPTTSGVGGSYSWKSKKSGQGKMIFDEVVENQFTKSTLIFMEGEKEYPAIVTMKLTPQGEKTQILWELDSKDENPFLARGMMLLMNMNGKIKNDFDQGLTNLEKYLLSNKSTLQILGYSIQQSQFANKNYLGKRAKVPFKEVPHFFETHLPKIGELANKQIIGPASGLYWTWDEKNQFTDMAAVMPVSINEFKNDEYNIIQIPSSKDFTADYYGAYEQTPKAYKALDSALKLNGFSKPDIIIEEYITDPMVQKDTSKWLTKIHFLVK